MKEMKDFSCYSPVELVMEKHAQRRVGEYIKKYGGHKVLIHHDDAIHIRVYMKKCSSLSELPDWILSKQEVLFQILNYHW